MFEIQIILQMSSTDTSLDNESDRGPDDNLALHLMTAEAIASLDPFR